jgi:hypothetical protein
MYCLEKVTARRLGSSITLCTLYTVHLFRELKKRELVVCDYSDGGSSITLTLCTLYT